MIRPLPTLVHLGTVLLQGLVLFICGSVYLLSPYISIVAIITLRWAHSNESWMINFLGRYSLLVALLWWQWRDKDKWMLLQNIRYCGQAAAKASDDINLVSLVPSSNFTHPVLFSEQICSNHRFFCFCRSPLDSLSASMAGNRLEISWSHRFRVKL